MRNALARFMMGRYGSDSFNNALSIGALVCFVLGAFFRRGLIGRLLDLLAYGMLFYAFYRMLSRDFGKRREENTRFLSWWFPVQQRFQQKSAKLRDREHCYFTCPNCAATVRVPRGKGKICITCPKCHQEFVRKT